MAKQKKKTLRRNKPAKKTQVLMVCKDHESYKAIYPPKNDCISCWKIYATRMRLVNKALKIELKELKNARRQ